MVRDPWLERQLARPAVHARLQKIWLLILLSTLLSLAAGVLALLLLVLSGG